MVRDPIPQCRDRAVVAAIVEFAAAIGLIRHAGRALEGGPLVPVPDVEEVEHPAHLILPAIAIEGRGIAAPIGVEPFRGLGRKIHVHGLGDRREEERRRGRVMIHEHLRSPAHHAVHHRAHLRLTLRQEVAIHVEAEMAVATRDAPRLGLLERERMVGADGDRVIPGGEPLVPVGVGRRIEHHHHRLEDLERLRFVRRRQLIGHLQRRLEPRRFVAVDRVVEYRHGRTLRGDRRGARGRRLPWVGEFRHAGADLIELGQVRGIGDDQRSNRPVLGRTAPRLDPHAVARGGDQGVEIVLHHCVHRVLLAGRVAGDRFGAWHSGAIRATRVEVERYLGGKRGHERHDGQQGKAGAHGCTVVCRGV